jgi:O-antigen/teichoic acid export membrane protein
VSLKKNVIANFLGQGWVALMGLAFIPVYIKYLGIESFGLIGFFAMMQAWLALLDFGMTPTINREMARYTAGGHTTESINNLLRSLEIICVSIGFLIVLIVWLTSNWIANIWLNVNRLPLDQVASAISLIGLVVALRFWEGLYRSAIIGLQKQVWLNIILSISATLRWAGAALVVWIVPEINAYFLWHGFVSVATIISFIFALKIWIPKTHEPAHFSLVAIKNVWAFAKGMLLTTILASGLTQIDKLLLSKIISLESFGYYTLAGTVVAVLYQVVIPITQAYYPKMTEQATRDDINQLTATYHQASQLVTVFLVSISFLVILFSTELLELWTGDVKLVSATAPLLSVLAIGTMLNGLMYMPYMLQLAYGWSSFAVRVNSVAILFLAPTILWITPKYGAIGAAWCWVALNTGYLTIALHYMHKKVLRQEKWRWYVNDFGLPTFAIGAIVSISYVLYPDSLSVFLEFIWLIVTLGISFITGLLFASKIPTNIFIHKYFRSF